MRYFLEVSESEMAGELQRPKSTIKYWLRTARKRLRQLLIPRQTARARKPMQPLPVPKEGKKEV